MTERTTNEEAAPSGWQRNGAGLISLWCPMDWEQPDAAGAVSGNEGAGVDYIAVRSDPASTFRMNVVVTHMQSSASIEEASSHVIAAAYDQHPGALIFGCDIWMWAPFPGRSITFSYPAGDASIIVSRWVFATGRHLIHLVASRSSDEFVLSGDLFSAIATSITFSEDA